MKFYRLISIFFILNTPSIATASQPITELFETHFVQYWQAGDAEAIAALWADDGDWSNIIGSRKIQQGNKAVKAVWEIGLQGRTTPEAREINVKLSNIRMLDDSNAVVDVLMTFTPNREQPMREAYVFILHENKGRWQIVSARAARLPAS